MPRTTLDLHDDLLHALKRMAAAANEPMTQVANRLLRLGLAQAQAPRPTIVSLPTLDLGRPLLPVDNVAETLAVAEGEGLR